MAVKSIPGGICDKTYPVEIVVMVCLSQTEYVLNGFIIVGMIKLRSSRDIE